MTVFGSGPKSAAPVHENTVTIPATTEASTTAKASSAF